VDAAVAGTAAAVAPPPRQRDVIRRLTHPRLGRRRTVFAASALVGLVTAAISISTVSLTPPGLHFRVLTVGAAETHVLVDAPPSTAPERPPYSTILDFDALPQDFYMLSERADMLATLMVSESVVNEIASAAGVPADSLYAYQSPDSTVPVAMSEPSNEKRAYQIQGLRRPNILEIQVRPTAPIIDIYAQAPSAPGAKALADAAVTGLRRYLTKVGGKRLAVNAQRIDLHQLEPARGALVSSGRKKIAILTFVTFFALTWLLLGLLLKLRRSERASPAPPPSDHRAARVPVAGGAHPAALRRVSALRASVMGGDWPRTSRVLPWMLAMFIAMVWLVPFDQIQLNVSLPITLPLDRLFLPIIFGVWVLTMRAGGPGAPTIRRTWIHGAIGAFGVVALLSVVLNAPELNHTLELMAGIKRIPLFASYGVLFIMFASVLRPTEVNAFVKYMLVLAVITSVGMLVEYRASYNIFYTLAHSLFPSQLFTVPSPVDGVDALGRRLVRGASSQPLEAVGMLSLALPIALVGIMKAKRWGPRLWYCLAACLMLAAMASTYRKSSLIAPVSVIATLAYFRPRQMIKMAPLAVVMLAVVHLAAPGAFGSVTAQLNSNRLNVPTVSDRVNRYDAVRPDLWSHLAFGRGMGTYDHIAHRILDSEVLDRLIETGLLGLVSYMLMMVATVLVARRVIRTRGPTAVAPALIGAAAAVSFIVVSTLYDALEFPHAPYLFLCMAGLVAVVSSHDDEEAAGPNSAHVHPRRRTSGPLLRSSREMRGSKRVVRS
jgi:hypothetical protein